MRVLRNRQSTRCNPGAALKSRMGALVISATRRPDCSLSLLSRFPNRPIRQASKQPTGNHVPRHESEEMEFPTKSSQAERAA